MLNFNKNRKNLSSVKLMGVLNITPDSFSDGGKYSSIDSVLEVATEMVDSGVYILDVGGESTRPGAESVSLEEEMFRVIPVIRALKENFPKMLISIDTHKSTVAQSALEEGVDWVNDISGGTFSNNMFDIVREFGATIVISHIKGSPKNMQKEPQYIDPVAEISQWLDKRANIAIQSGIYREKIILDPGIGFGKRFEDNITILNNLESFKSIGFPLMLGSSRKSFIGHFTGEKNASKRDPGSYVTFVWSAAMGVDYLRVHNVPGSTQALKMAGALLEWRGK